MEFLELCGIELGTHKIEPVKEGHKLNRERGEIWYSKKHRTIMYPIIKGVSNSFEERCRLNAKFVKWSNKVLPVKHLYFAGAPMPYPLEYKLGRRLLSYHEVGRVKDGKLNKCLQRHVELVKERA